ncbi:SDR family oxidoreductase [Fodinisporobacter ferrooxydans]|uniref:SDR family oxidoreductase n=1 Tax=Fodinisporobacter ferrooxydans TaxID=2901836 RepID=A0ABY4CF55_9BACL|nr:SDR family oxidoreductase [Alicyclobacillaceae bacterium MYW30-H2]
MKIDLSNKTALVTGASGQLGRVMARTLASCGADVVIHYLKNETMARSLQNEIEALGRQALPLQADLTDADAAAKMKSQIFDRFDSLDILVANAVSQYTWTTILEQDLDDYVDQFETCVMQNVLLIKAFVPHMIERGYGRVIGINTECAMQNFPTQSAYVAGKRGMDGIYRILAKEVGEHQITVNQVAPGWTISDRDRENQTEIQAAYSASVPLKRRGTDQEIANVVAFLASDLASFITGAYIPVCGGNVMPTI